ncbi:RHS repeat-associated core domain-containing protein [Pseudomonas sp. CGJS7]|uniref:RHS repeat-associated core domain-containing protein n=1 Tax=Pseudomonas sp. CGJS7 TaxID=3109348 RepID=UPI003009C709
MKTKGFALALSLCAAWSSPSLADVVPWKWNLTVYDSSNNVLEAKEFTSRGAAEQYLWASSPTNDTLREVSYIGETDRAEYKYKGSRFQTYPGDHQYQVSVLKKNEIGQWERGWAWFRTEAEAEVAYKHYLTFWWGEYNYACAPIIELGAWDAMGDDPYDSQRRSNKITAFERNDKECRLDRATVFSDAEFSKQRITNHDNVENRDGLFFKDPPLFVGLPQSIEVDRSGPPNSDGNFSHLQWSVRSLRTAKLIGQPNHCGPLKGNPCDITRGSKHETATDAAGHGPLGLTRTYNSTDSGGSYGLGWRGPYEYLLMRSEDGYDYVLTTPDGKQTNLTVSAGRDGGTQMYRSRDNRSAGMRLYYTPGGARMIRVEFPGLSIDFRPPTPKNTAKPVQITYNGSETVALRYDHLDRLERAEHRGRAIQYVYEYTDLKRTHKVSAAVMPDGRLITYQHSTDGLLERVADDSGELFKYGYKAGTTLLTSILESGDHLREYRYDDFSRLIGSVNGPVEHGYAYTPTQTTVTFPGGRTEVTNFESTTRRRPVREETIGGLTTTTTYTDYDDTVTESNNAGLTVVTKYGDTSSTVQTSLNNVLERTAITTFDAGTSRPKREEVKDASGTLVQQTDFTYNSRQQLLTVTRKDPKTSEQRVATLNYCEDSDLSAPGTACATVGAVKSSDGPRTDVNDVTTFGYYTSDASTCSVPDGACPYRKGDLRQRVDALGGTTEILNYSPFGTPLSVRDANGVVTDYEYHPRGWLTASKVRGDDNAVETDDRITRVEHWPTGLVKKITLPGNVSTSFVYDAAERLTKITDNAGNTLSYTLDEAGNPKQEDIKTANGTLKRTLSRVFNTLGQMEAVKDASQNPTGFRYDKSGNPDRVTDALLRKTDRAYDPLNRLRTVLQDAEGLKAETNLEYNAFDQITKVKDPKRLDTVYHYNGFGELTKLTSPDTGVTDYTYSVGLLATKKDANDPAAHRYTYDALSRPKAIFYTATGPVDVEYDYDTVNAECVAGETFAVGRVTAMRADGTELKYCYDRFGQIVRKLQIVAGKSFLLRYGYTVAGDLRTMTYPNGTVVDYVRDTQRKIREIGIKPPGLGRTVLLNNATYEPFGPVTGWTYGNGRALSRSYDLDYRPKTVFDPATGGLSLGYGYNTVGELVELKNGQNTATQAKYDYDTLGRLTVTRDGPSNTALETYGYDTTGNRTSLLRTGITDNYNYASNSHRLNGIGPVSRGYDAVGNTTNIGGTAKEFVYNANDRMKQVKLGGAVKMGYRYNALGERVAAINTDTGPITIYTLYDEVGQWVGDYDSTGAAIQQAIWLSGAPVGLLVGAGTNPSTMYVQPDHLGTPRSVIDPTRNVAIWTWDAKSEVFGSTPPNQDADLDGTPFVFNMRFPGQRYDPNTGLSYNYFRDYDPATGRYVQSDPIGLYGGISTFAYVAGSPNRNADKYGLQAPPEEGNFWVGAGKALHDAIAPVAHAIVDPYGTNIDPSCDYLGPGRGLVEQGGYKFGSALIIAETARSAGSMAGGLAPKPVTQPSLAARVAEVHAGLDPIAANMRTTAGLETTEGVTIFGGGARDLTPAQRALLGPGEVAAKLPGAHAEVTNIMHALNNGLTPKALEVSRPMCPLCQREVVNSGGTIVSPTRAEW